MYELNGTIQNVSTDYQTGQAILTLSIEQRQTAFKCFDELKDAEKLTIQIDKYSEKRSLNANSYMWLLCSKLAEKLSDTTTVKHTKEDIYRNTIREVGLHTQMEINKKAVNTLIHSWSLHGIGWFSEKVDYGAKDGFVILNMYYGSSCYKKHQMKRLIDSLVQDCHAVGIETKTPDEIANLISLWGEER